MKATGICETYDFPIATLITVENASSIIGINKETLKEMLTKVHKGGTENKWLGEISLCILGEKRNTYYIFLEALLDRLKLKKVPAETPISTSTSIEKAS